MKPIVAKICPGVLYYILILLMAFGLAVWLVKTSPSQSRNRAAPAATTKGG